jgi:large subunit ribosomal protein L23
MENHDVLKYPLSSEKAVRLMQSENKILFIVHLDATKRDVKLAVEGSFKVKVKKVNTLIDKEGHKRAYVQLAPEFPAIDITTKLGLM